MFNTFHVCHFFTFLPLFFPSSSMPASLKTNFENKLTNVQAIIQQAVQRYFRHTVAASFACILSKPYKTKVTIPTREDVLFS